MYVNNISSFVTDNEFVPVGILLYEINVDFIEYCSFRSFKLGPGFSHKKEEKTNKMRLDQIKLSKYSFQIMLQ